MPHLSHLTFTVVFQSNHNGIKPRIKRTQHIHKFPAKTTNKYAQVSVNLTTYS